MRKERERPQAHHPPHATQAHPIHARTRKPPPPPPPHACHPPTQPSSTRQQQPHAARAPVPQPAAFRPPPAPRTTTTLNQHPPGGVAPSFSLNRTTVCAPSRFPRALPAWSCEWLLLQSGRNAPHARAHAATAGCHSRGGGLQARRAVRCSRGGPAAHPPHTPRPQSVFHTASSALLSCSYSTMMTVTSRHTRARRAVAPL